MVPSDQQPGSYGASGVLPTDVRRIAAARHHDPFAVLGKHREGEQEVVRAFLPGADGARVDGRLPMRRYEGTDVFEWRGGIGSVPDRYRVSWTDGDGEHAAWDPYCFPPQVPDFDLHLFGQGRHWHAYRFLGSHPREVDGVHGVLFATWAPNAERVSVVGDFNRWDGRRHPMRVRGGSGVWELFVPGLEPGARYKFEIRNARTGSVQLKADPYARSFEQRPKTASVVDADAPFAWLDGEWIEARRSGDWLHAPFSVYEVHLGSWQRDDSGHFLNYREIASRLIPYVKGLGFTHIELLPVTEHPLDASWGYQTIGYFAPTSRFGSGADFAAFVDACHRAGLGVLLDWAPGHFPRDQHGLAHYDGTALYEHADPRLGEHRDWGTLIFNYGRNEVRNFLLSSALYWLDEFHIDGLRVDAVASMLYLDYSREAGDWIPNQYGGNENLDAIAFVREMNADTQGQHPGTLIIAEESTAWPQVTRPTWVGGLGFSMKWNMGWMHDTLQYFGNDPVFRSFQHDQLTFGLLYAFTENFVLPFSHDEVVHGKGSMIGKMPGDEWQRFANLRLLYTYMWTYPGKKLLFMGGEFAQSREWNHEAALEWELLQYPLHRGVQTLVSDLNRLMREFAPLHRFDFAPEGFEWIDCHDAQQSVLNYLRAADGEIAVIALNFTPVPRFGYRIGVPRPGRYREALNSDSAHYGGSDVGNAGAVHAEPVPWMGRPYSLPVTLPPLAGVVFIPE